MFANEIRTVNSFNTIYPRWTQDFRQQMHGIPLGKIITTVTHIKSTANLIRSKYIHMPVRARDMFAIFNVFQGKIN